MQLADHIVFLLLGILLPAGLFVSGYRRQRASTAGRRMHFPPGLKIRLYYGNGLLLLSLAAICLTVTYFGGRPLASLGLSWGRMPYDALSIGLLGGFTLLYLGDLALEVGSPDRRNESRANLQQLGFLPASGPQFLHFIFLAVSAGVGEEIVYRGYLIGYLDTLLPHSPLGIFLTLFVPAVAFGLGHFYQGRGAVVKIVAMAILFGVFFYRTQTLWPLMLVHTAVDVVGGLVSWALLSPREG